MQTKNQHGETNWQSINVEILHKIDTFLKKFWDHLNKNVENCNNLSSLTVNVSNSRWKQIFPISKQQKTK